MCCRLVTEVLDAGDPETNSPHFRSCEQKAVLPECLLITVLSTPTSLNGGHWSTGDSEATMSARLVLQEPPPMTSATLPSPAQLSRGLHHHLVWTVDFTEI